MINETPKSPANLESIIFRSSINEYMAAKSSSDRKVKLPSYIRHVLRFTFAESRRTEWKVLWICITDYTKCFSKRIAYSWTNAHTIKRFIFAITNWRYAFVMEDVKGNTRPVQIQANNCFTWPSKFAEFLPGVICIFKVASRRDVMWFFQINVLKSIIYYKKI